MIAGQSLMRLKFSILLFFLVIFTAKGVIRLLIVKKSS